MGIVGIVDGPDEEDVQDKRTSRIKVKLGNLPTCFDIGVQVHQDDGESTAIYFAVALGGAVVASVLLFSFFCLRKYFRRQKNKKVEKQVENGDEAPEQVGKSESV